MAAILNAIKDIHTLNNLLFLKINNTNKNAGQKLFSFNIFCYAPTGSFEKSVQHLKTSFLSVFDQNKKKKSNKSRSEYRLFRRYLKKRSESRVFEVGLWSLWVQFIDLYGNLLSLC